MVCVTVPLQYVCVRLCETLGTNTEEKAHVSNKGQVDFNRQIIGHVAGSQGSPNQKYLPLWLTTFQHCRSLCVMLHGFCTKLLEFYIL